MCVPVTSSGSLDGFAWARACHKIGRHEARATDAALFEMKLDIPKYLLLAVLQLSCVASAFSAAPVQVSAPAGSSNPSPTFTLLYEVENPQLTLLTVLGGEGRVGINEASTGTRNQTAQMAQILTRKDFTPLRINIVVFDSPVELFPSRARAESDHLDRVESVVRFYQDRFKMPVWLLGHSNGTISVTEYLNRKQVATPVAGAVLSGSVYQINLKDGMNLPLLFLHHEEDGCKNTPFSYAKRNFQQAKGFNKSLTEFLVVKGGEEQGDPCRNGKHMYLGSYEEAARQLADFLVRAVK